MKTLLITHIHSYVDLITNSSSELFIISGQKTLADFKEILKELVTNYNIDAEEAVDLDNLFTTIFNEPYVCKYNIDLNSIPEYRVYKNNWSVDFSKWPNTIGPKLKFYRDLEKKVEKELDLPKDLKQREAIYDTPEYKLHITKIQDIYSKEREARDAELSIITNIIAQQNNLNITEELNNLIRTAQNYNIMFTKGDIILESESDNSIPWELMERIQSILSSSRYHLG